MIVLDTHVWVWWTLDVRRLSDAQQRVIEILEYPHVGAVI